MASPRTVRGSSETERGSERQLRTVELEIETHGIVAGQTADDEPSFGVHVRHQVAHTAVQLPGGADGQGRIEVGVGPDSRIDLDGAQNIDRSRRDDGVVVRVPVVDPAPDGKPYAPRARGDGPQRSDGEQQEIEKSPA